MTDKDIAALYRDRIQMFILDVLRHDVIEQVTSILKLLNSDGGIGWRDLWPHDFTPSEVIPALVELVSAGYIRALREHETSDQLVEIRLSELDISRDQDILWFGLTDEGYRAWDRWEPPRQDS
jgi:hypothetical protein